MRQVLNNLVELLSGLGLSFGELRHSQRTFARLAREVDAAAAHLDGASGSPDSADLSALADRLREVARATEAATMRSAADLDRIRSGLIRAATMVAELSRKVMRPPAAAPVTGPWSPDPLERHPQRDAVAAPRPGASTG